MTKRIYIIAGEASGDVIGGELMKALKAQCADVAFAGLGGDRMQAEGLKSLFDIRQIALMGFVEIVPHIPRLHARIQETVADIIAKQPDMLITIDSPGFTFRVVKALKKQGFKAPCVHYVAPTVWAYKPKRAEKTAKLFDRLLCILPFEPKYFTAHGLQADFVGHPIAWQHRARGNGESFRIKHHIPTEAVVLCMMPGSRHSELLRHLPIFRESVVRLRKSIPSLQIIMPTNENIALHVQTAIQDWPVPVTLVEDADQKADAFAACDLALAKSGTVALEIALAGVPSITTFRANPVSVALVRRMIRVPYVNLMNIMAFLARNPAPIPELLQERCNPKAISAVLLNLWNSKAAQKAQLEACSQYCEQLGMFDEKSPSEKAAANLLPLLNIQSQG